jgi:energy-coupling factor transporter ATP-binding protein EcfA2
VMLRGPSGGGKTTMMNILGTIDKPTGGTIGTAPPPPPPPPFFCCFSDRPRYSTNHRPFSTPAVALPSKSCWGPRSRPSPTTTSSPCSDSRRSVDTRHTRHTRHSTLDTRHTTLDTRHSTHTRHATHGTHGRTRHGTHGTRCARGRAHKRAQGSCSRRSTCWPPCRPTRMWSCP